MPCPGTARASSIGRIAAAGAGAMLISTTVPVMIYLQKVRKRFNRRSAIEIRATFDQRLSMSALDRRLRHAMRVLDITVGIVEVDDERISGNADPDIAHVGGGVDGVLLPLRIAMSAAAAGDDVADAA